MLGLRGRELVFAGSLAFFGWQILVDVELVDRDVDVYCAVRRNPPLQNFALMLLSSSFIARSALAVCFFRSAPIAVPDNSAARPIEAGGFAVEPYRLEPATENNLAPPGPPSALPLDLDLDIGLRLVSP